MIKKRKSPTVEEKLYRELVWVAEHPERCQQPWRTAAELASWIGVEVEDIRPLLDAWVQQGTVEVGLKGLPNPWTRTQRATVWRYRLAKDLRPVRHLLLSCRCAQEGRRDAQRLHQYRLKAQHYDTMYRALTGQFDWFDPYIDASNPQQTIDQLPKTIARGRPVAWYREQAERYQTQAEQLSELQDAMSDLRWKTAFERMSHAERVAALREQAARIVKLQEMIREWQERQVKHELEAIPTLAEEGLTPEALEVRQWMVAQSDPAPMLEILHRRLREMEEEQQWRLEHL
jgi:hypothetical protein